MQYLFFLIVSVLCFQSDLVCQNTNIGFKTSTHSLSFNAEDTFQYFMFEATSIEKRPVFIFVGGSGCGSNFGFTKRKWATHATDSIIVVAFDKVGVTKEANAKNCTDKYYEYDYKSARVKQCNILIDHLKTLPQVDTSKIYLCGYSEGTEVVAKVGFFSGVILSESFGFARIVKYPFSSEYALLLVDKFKTWALPMG